MILWMPCACGAEKSDIQVSGDIADPFDVMNEVDHCYEWLLDFHIMSEHSRALGAFIPQYILIEPLVGIVMSRTPAQILKMESIGSFFFSMQLFCG